MLTYQVGRVVGVPVTLGEIHDVWTAFEDARANPLVDPIVRQSVTANWHRLRHVFEGPMALPDNAARVLVLHNFGIDEVANRGAFIVGSRVFTPGAARHAVAHASPFARPLIALGRQFARSLVEVSGLPL